LSRTLSDFAQKLGWRPSDKVFDSKVSEFVNAHLIVEHGLEHSSVITFLKGKYRFRDLNYDQRSDLFSISYNNLIDWHINIDSFQASYIYNRTDPPETVQQFDISSSNIENIRSEVFERIIGKKPNPNFPALDECLIKTISFWKRNLSSILSDDVGNKELSALFNGIIFIRAIEDYKKKTVSNFSEPLFIDKLNSFNTSEEFNFSQTLKTYLIEILNGSYPEEFLDERSVDAFSNLDFIDAYQLISDFYNNKYAPYYNYDFSLISKHALSNIYEHYVTLLRYEESSQLSMFPQIPFEERDKSFGAVYTPQYIARFFGRFLEKQMLPSSYKKIKTIDPACGSGIFLRTLLELQYESLSSRLNTEGIQKLFFNVHGIDIDENACNATKLSLSLLHLILTGELPKELNIKYSNSLTIANESNFKKEAYEAILCNPPFVSYDNLTNESKELLKEYLSSDATGRVDLYLSFLKFSIELLKPGAFGLFVIPHSFLFSKSAKGIRKLLYNKTWIRILADLSSVRVFEENDIYVMLLVFQKKSEQLNETNGKVLKCKEFPGIALQDLIEGKSANNEFYRIFDISQAKFGNDEWFILPPEEDSIIKKFSSFPKLNNFLRIRTGFISGNDQIFILEKEHIDEEEYDLFKPYLTDREMIPYRIKRKSNKYFFYPYINGEKLTGDSLKEKFPSTWKYLQKNKKTLELRSPVKKGNLPWWCPNRPRPPRNILVPKIIVPHLVLTPKFSVDIKGKYMVSRSPLLHLRDDEVDIDLLYYYLGVLNSSPCFWFVSNYSHKYGSNYAMLEPKTLGNTPIPDPEKISFMNLSKIIKLTQERCTSSGSEAKKLEKEIDQIVANLYKLNGQELELIGMDS
jgi:type I restriction-modification system DNA methylase subunit